MTQTETWTVGKLLEWTTQYLRKQGSESPRLDAEVLLAHARNCQRIQLYTSFDEEPDETVKTAFREMVRRRAEGAPVAYLVGHKEFYSLAFRVSPDVLIPRSETEDLVVIALDRAKLLLKNLTGETDYLQIADICTGSGCIAVSVAKHQQQAKIIACDLSPAALEIAKSNITKHGMENRIELRHSDLFESIAESQFDLILSNPPYVSEGEYNSLPKSVLDYEPKLALLAGPTGLEVIERLIDQSSSKLKTGGFLIMEISPMLAASVTQLLSKRPEWLLENIAKDLAGHARVVIARRQNL